MSLQSKTERLVYDAIDDISDELGIYCDSYPEVYHVHKNFPFERLGLPERDREDFEDVKKFSKGMYLFNKEIILLSSQDTYEIYEESGHFIHLNHSGLNYKGKSKRDLLFTETIIEAIGYFCSKLGDSNRKLHFRKYTDYFENREKCLEEIETNDLDPNYFFIYQQRYGIGEKLFNHYIAGLTSKEKIVELMHRNLEGKYDATYEFIKLKHLVGDSFMIVDWMEKFIKLNKSIL